MTTLVRDISRRVLADLVDDDPAFTRWSERYFVDRLNDAQMIIARFLPIASVNDHAIQLVPGVRQSIRSIDAARIRVDGAQPSTGSSGLSIIAVHHTMGTNGVTPGRPLRIVSKQLQDNHNPGWITSVGEFPDEVMIDPLQPDTFWVCPGVSTQVPVWIQMSYTAVPAMIPDAPLPGDYAPNGTSSRTISLGDEYRDDIASYIVARSCMQDGKHADPVKAQTFTNIFLQSIGQKVQSLTGTNPNLKRLPLNVAEIGGTK